MEVSATLTAYISPNSSLSPDDLAKPACIPQLILWGAHMESSAASLGYTKVGTAQVTVTMPDRDTLIANKLEALRNKAASVRAEATAKCTRIETQIQNLLCIGNDSAAVFAAPTAEVEL